jgi:uncharacterized protein
MAGDLLYLDSSALVKLVLPEAESGALLESLAAWPVRITSELARIEVVRAARRTTSDPGAEQRAEEVLAGLYLLKIDSDVLSEAARLEPRTLRSLDAIHLASALSLGADLGPIVTYDSNMATAAEDYGLAVLAPQAPPSLDDDKAL